jgi:MazG family protein
MVLCACALRANLASASIAGLSICRALFASAPKFRSPVLTLLVLNLRQQMKSHSGKLTCDLSLRLVNLLGCSGGSGSFVPSRGKRIVKLGTRVRPKSCGEEGHLIPTSRRDKFAGKWFEKLVALQSRLYGPGGCPWDREQTHESLRKYLIEETYEVLDAMDSGDPRKFSGELGDLLLQVVFHSILAEQAGRFTISDVIESVHAKMVRRHPHVFGGAGAKTSAAVLKNWEQIKAGERLAERREVSADPGKRVASNSRAKASVAGSCESVLTGVPSSLPAVLEAYQLTRRASHVGFDWENLAGILAKLDEEKRELRQTQPPRARNGKASSPSQHTEEEVGDLLFVAVNVARFLGVDPEIALKKANRKFKRRFNWMEASATRQGHRFADLSRDRMEELWNQSKTSDQSGLGSRVPKRHLKN